MLQRGVLTRWPQDKVSLRVHWTTHSPRGLTAKDILMARFCDDQAAVIGTVDQTEVIACGATPGS